MGQSHKTLKLETKESRQEIVFQKLLKSLYVYKHTEDELKTLAKQISDPEELLNSYLSTDWTKTLKIHQETEKNQEKRSNSIFSSNVDLTSHVQSKDDENFFVDEETTSEDIEKSKINPEFNLKKEVKIKLIISEVATNETEKFQRKMITPILNSFHLSPKLGLFHSGIMIGPWIVEWKYVFIQN